MLDHQLVVFTYHKTGTAFFENVLRRVGERFGLRMAKFYGMVPALPGGPDIVIVAHSLLTALPPRSFRAVRSLRDPRDIWVSGYLYHRHCEEPWSISTDFDDRGPIVFPRVPIVFQHRRERWKRDYLCGLGGRSYQANLLERDRAAGLRFELDHYTGETLEAMRGWAHAADPRIRDVRMEEIAADFEGTMAGVFRHLGFPETVLSELLALAAREDVGRMDAATLEANRHIHGRELSKWRGFLSTAEVRLIESRFGDVIERHGYRLSSAA